MNYVTVLLMLDALSCLLISHKQLLNYMYIFLIVKRLIVSVQIIFLTD